MLGAILGDIIGSRTFRLAECIQKEFPLFTPKCHFTDDTVMTVAVADALTQPFENIDDLSRNTIATMHAYYEQYPDVGYGLSFEKWLKAKCTQPYGSYGNGAAMRISSVGWIATSIEEVKKLSYAVTSITHNHPEGIKGAESVAMAIFLARTGYKKEDIQDYIHQHYYPMDFTLDQIRPNYIKNTSCQGSVPEALKAFFESHDFESAVRLTISLNGDTDTQSAIAGAIAEAYYDIPQHICSSGLIYLSPDLYQRYYKFAQSNITKKHIR